ncbi:hypothetical protein JOC86_002302 [Bacillus pakistanensis]|uniref:AlgX/AlgJ SGNH hydrolase-like domain-containing protein n=1 Tax=Rossellomorea pakistanensis TaxID=992288 RepID=A0ABS2ND73_9BACI|nr:hypothetical protein [Bacillus pakistanensis]
MTKEDNKKSEFENRALAQRPSISKNEIFSGEFFKNYETYFTDQFYQRDKWVKTFILWQLRSNKTYVNGYHVTDDGWILGKPMEGLAKKDLNISAKNIKELSDYLSQKDSELYFSPFPAKVNETTGSLPWYVSKGTGNENYHYLMSKLEEKNINLIDISGKWNEKFSDEEIKEFYMKTDHHWNMLGAFKGYQLIMENLSSIYEGIPTDYNKENYKYTCEKDKKFVGSWNRSLYKLIDTSIDDFCYFTPVNYSFQDLKVYKGKVSKKNMVSDNREIYASGVKDDLEEFNYHTAYADNYPELNIINEESKNDLKVLILKDSYTNPLIFHMAHHFHHTTIYDSRYNYDRSVYDYLEKNDYDIVLITLNTNNIRGKMYNFEQPGKK